MLLHLCFASAPTKRRHGNGIPLNYFLALAVQQNRMALSTQEALTSVRLKTSDAPEGRHLALMNHEATVVIACINARLPSSCVIS